MERQPVKMTVVELMLRYLLSPEGRADPAALELLELLDALDDLPSCPA